MSIRPRPAAALALLWPATLLADDLPSQWRADGVTSDPMSWAGVPFEQEVGLDIGAVNNADYLWVCLYPSNRRVQTQLLLGGATVWILDEDGDRLGAVRFRPEPPPGEKLPAAVGPRDAIDPQALKRRVDDALSGFDILDRDGDVIETRRREDAGEVEVRVEASEYVYFVVRVPLARVEAALLALGVVPGTTIGLGVETPQLERPAMARPRGAPGGPDGGEPPDGGGRRGPPPGVELPFIPPDPIRYWAVLELASPHYDEAGEAGDAGSR